MTAHGVWALAGVVKVTPAHDPKDFECGLRHNLPEREVIDKDGRMCGSIDERYKGLDRFEARKKIVEELKEMELYIDKVRYWWWWLPVDCSQWFDSNVSTCVRSWTIRRPFRSARDRAT